MLEFALQSTAAHLDLETQEAEHVLLMKDK